jgi:hypothetical protein
MAERDLTQAEIYAFVADLTELTRRHGIKIDACGCCDSPWLIGGPVVREGTHYTYTPDGGGLEWVE